MPFKLPSYSDLNETQKMLIQLLPKTERLAVVGGPGTGKTIIGVQGAIAMMNERKKVLFLSYSRTLKFFLQNIADDNDLDISEITIETFHRWFYYYLQKKFDVSEEDIRGVYEKERFVYNVERLEGLLDTCGLTDEELIDYDCIIIDEAQDIQDGMMKILKRLTRQIFVTFDDSQKVGNEEKNIDALEYDHSNILNDLGIGDRFFDLIDNYRNSRAVESLAKQFLSSYDENEVSLLKSTAKRVGDRPKLLISEDGDLSRIAKYIVDHHDASKSVGVLFGSDHTGRGERSWQIFDELRDAFRKTMNDGVNFFYKFGQTNINARNALSNGIFLMTMKSSKGLEFDEIYVIADDFGIEKMVARNALYVAITRARDKVTIVNLPLSETNKGIHEKLKQMKDVLSEERL